MLQKNDYYRLDDSVYRVVGSDDSRILVINCSAMTMPKWVEVELLSGTIQISAEEALSTLGIERIQEEQLTAKQLRQCHQRYTTIAGILSFLEDDRMRNAAIKQAAEVSGKTRRTITNYLCRYLITGDISSLRDEERNTERELTQDEKIMRWALNKYYYTRHKNKLTDAYVMMLKEKYTDAEGKLLPLHPSIYQFRYFFNETRKKQTEIISREGIKEYQLNHRPLLGDGVQEYAPVVGTFALDATICDLYLVDSSGNLVGRPILVAAVDMHSGMCTGYSLLWEGGVYSCRELLLNIITDKPEWCRKFGIVIEDEQWDCNQLPGIFITDRGSEYISYNFEQITELGCQLVSLPSFSANQKGPVEKLFDLVQESYKPYLRGKGVIEPDHMKRGIHDYRKDACLTIEQFEKIVVRCILYHNNSRVLENYPFTKKLIEEGVKPTASSIWNYGKIQPGANLISVTKKQLVLTLLPRTQGKFTRYGLKVNKMRYHCEGYTEQYLNGGEVTVAYNPDDVSEVYLVDDDYRAFDLIEKRFSGKSLDEVLELHKTQSNYTKSFAEEQLQAKVELAKHIEAIAADSMPTADTDIKGVTKRRQRARSERHQDLMKGVKKNE